MKITDEKLVELLKGMELEEPSMSFTRNIMDQVDQEIAPISLKTKVDRRIIIAISTVFMLGLILTITYAIINSGMNYELPKLNLDMNINKELSSMMLKAFLFIDLIIALLYLDSFLRRKKA
jgi:magnesium-transporting ATPase (P-type)